MAEDTAGDDLLPEMYFSVDVESNGPLPGEYSMTALGCVVVGHPERAFYAELQPITDRVDSEAEAVSGLTLGYLRAHGSNPAEVMRRFRDWVAQMVSGTYRPVFVALNATYDWMFVHWYLMRFVGENPFSFGGLDIKAYYMGMFGVLWQETGSRHIAARLGIEQGKTHHALDDAHFQAALFQKMLDARAAR